MSPKIGRVWLALLAVVIAPAPGSEDPEAQPPCYYAFVSDVTVPDGTVMSPGQEFVKTWRLRNRGTTDWSICELVFYEGEQMSAPSPLPVPFTPPGETADLSVPMTAPSETGHHSGRWYLRPPEKPLYGWFYVQILVEGSTYRDRTLEEWAEDLHADSPAVREEALKAISNFGPKAESVLIEAFSTQSDERTRGLALAALLAIRSGSSDAVRVVLRAATDPSLTIKMFATLAIMERLPDMIGPQSVPALVEALGNADPTVRQSAFGLLAHLGPAAEEAAPALREMADHHADAEVREAAKRLLERIETP